MEHIQKNKSFKIELRFVILCIISVLAILLVTVLTYSSSIFIYHIFGNPPVISDLLWKIIPYLDILWISELFMLLSVLYLITWSIKENEYYIPYAILLFCIFHFFRALLIPLTPMGFPYEYRGVLHYGAKTVFMFGAFPSGHVSIPAFVFLITKHKIALIFSLLCGFALIASRGHYSIDIVGSFLLAFAIYKISEKYIKQYYIK